MSQKKSRQMRQIVRKLHPELEEKISDENHATPQFRYIPETFRFIKVKPGVPFRYAQNCQKFLVNMTKKARKENPQAVDFAMRFHAAATSMTI